MDCPECKKKMTNEDIDSCGKNYYCDPCERVFTAEFLNGYWRGYKEGVWDGNEEQLERLRNIL